MRIEPISRTLSVRLQCRCPEIEQATLTRIKPLLGVREESDPEYQDGLQAAISAAMGYGIEALERSEDHPAPIPTALLSQARLAARRGVALDAVLRRYLVGYTLLGDYIIEESDRDSRMDSAALKRLLRVQASVLDRLVTAVSEEYARETTARPNSAAQRRLRTVEQLLDGQRADPEGLAYDLNALHIGFVAYGNGALDAVDAIAESMDCLRLILAREEKTVWAWFASRRRIEAKDLILRLPGESSVQISMGIGEPGEGLAGWQRTHRQAKAAASVARLRGPGHVRYADVALLASVRGDDLLVSSLESLYLIPLRDRPDDGLALRDTLRAYFETGRAVSSAAAALGVHRRTVTNRLRTVEERVGRSLNECAIDLEVALKLDELLAK